MKSKTILIINYDFPPNPGIGGRRWAIFAKHLTLNGYDVHVIMKKPNSSAKSSFDIYVRGNKKITPHYIRGLYPKILAQGPRNLFGKIKYKCFSYLMKRISKGTPFDKSLLWSLPLRRKTRSIIQMYNPSAIIVTGAPFRLCYYAALESSKSKKIPLIIDLRDPWTWGFGYGYGSLDKKRKSHELMMEKFSLDNANLVLVPVKTMKDYLLSNYPELNGKLEVLPHGYDNDIISKNDGNRFKHDDILRIVHYGTLNDLLEDEIENLADKIQNLNGRVVLDLYGDSNKYFEIFAKHGVLGKFVIPYKSIPQEELFKNIGQYDFSLIIHPFSKRNYLSTKVYETIASGTPILYIGERGDLSEFLSRTQSGFPITPDEMRSLFNPQVIRNTFSFHPAPEIQEFSYAKLTSKLINLLNSVTKKP